MGGIVRWPHANHLFAFALTGTALLTGCGAIAPSSAASGAPTAPPTRPGTAAPSATTDPYAGWLFVSNFVAANENAYVASLRIPPSWKYVPADRSGRNCGRSVCYTYYSDTLQGPGGADVAMGGPTSQVSTCKDYAQAQTGAGYVQTGEEAITVSGIRTTEYTYTQQTGAGTYAQYIVPVESDLVGCMNLHAAGRPPVDHATIDRIFASIKFHPNS